MISGLLTFLALPNLGGLLRRGKDLGTRQDVGVERVITLHNQLVSMSDYQCSSKD